MTANAVPTVCDVQAQTPMGPLRISMVLTELSNARSSFDQLDIALALERCEPLLCELECWFGMALDPMPVQSAMPLAPGLSVTVDDNLLCPSGTRLHLPWEALLQRPPSGQTRLLQLPWPRLLCEVELARYPQSPAPREALQPARMLLLPGSFQLPWRVSLTDVRHSLELSASYTLNDSALQEFGAPHRGSSDGPAAEWRVVVAQPVEVPLELALGWRSSPLSLGTQPMQAMLLGPGERQPVVQGVVVAAFSGAALFIGDTGLPPYFL